MDSVMDPELAAEMVKLLGQELKVVRSQLREAEQRSGTPATSDVTSSLHLQREEALQAEIVSLKAENFSLQANISRLQDQITTVPVKMEDGHSSLVTQYEASMNAIQRELADAIREKNMAIVDKESVGEQLEEINSVREKYRKLKANKRECQELIDELRGQLQIFVEEREQMMSEGKPLESDPPSFFRNTNYPDVVDQPKRNDIPIYSNALSMGIPKSARTHCSCDGTLRLEKDVLMFAHAGISLGLILRPMYQYNPKKNNGTWCRLPPDIEPGKKKDLCYHDGHGWKYLGIYERIGDSFLLSPASIEKLSSPRVEAIAKQTVLFQDLVSPSQMRMVEKMYWDGLLQIEMFGIQCVAYNQEFAKHLFESRKHPPKSFAKDASPKGNKRKRGVETGETDNRRQKKSSKSGTKEG